MSIEVRRVSKRFGEFQALNDVSLTVPSGGLTALLGPSGSGKTTLLRIIAGLERTDPGGAILFDGEDVVGLHVRKRRVGFVFQHYALFRHMTVFDNVAFGLRVRPRRLRPDRARIRAKVEELLGLVQLEGLARRYPTQLSGGQRQRVALARALAVEPRVLLLDEPFGALDAQVRQELRAWLRRLHDQIPVTSVFVTHDQDEALEVADRVAVMNRGRIEQIGTPDEVFHRPRTEFVMGFLGNVNRFDGRIERGAIQIGGVAFAVPHQTATGCGHARVFVRPHELELSHAPNGHPSLPAQVARIHSAGASVRLELRSHDDASIVAELTQSRFRELGITPGDRVYLSPLNLRLFPQDYSI